MTRRTFFLRLLEDFNTTDPEELGRRQAFLHTILYFGIGTTVLGTLAIFILNPQSWSVVLLNSTLTLFQLGLLFMIWRGHTRLASILLIILLETYCALALYFYGGIRNPVSATLLVIIMVAATLLGQMGILLATLMAGGIALGLATIEMKGLLPVPIEPANPLQNWVAYFTSVLAGTIVMYAWLDQIRATMRRTQQEIKERKQVEAALRSSEERYRMISAVSSDYAFLTRVEANGKPYEEWVSDAFEAITGYTLPELQGIGWDQLVYPDDRGVDKQSYLKVLANERVTTEFRIIRQDGALRWVRVYAQPVWDAAQQRVTKFYGAVQDITERKTAEEAVRKSEARLRAVLDHIPYDLWVCDEAGRYITQNLKGDPLAQMAIGKTPLEIEGVPLEVRQRWQAEHQAALGGQKIRNEYVEYDPAGNKKTFIVSIAPILNNNRVIGLVGMSIDISDVKQAEEKVKLLNQDLEQMVAKRTAELEATVNELEAFSYSISHSVRTPLRAIHGYASILASEFGPHLPEAAQEYIRKIRRGARTMDDLINDLLDYNRYGRTRLLKTLVDVRDVFNVTFIALLKEQSGRRINSRVADLPPALADMRLLRVVASNLLSNAIKFSVQRQVAEIEVGFIKKEGQTIYYVKDNGIGFDMKFAPKLFKVFQRLIDPGTFEGTGVGLAIAERLIQKHGGKIWVEAAPDQGATFYFTLE